MLNLLITFVIAAASYRFFEKPFLKFKEKFEWIKTRAA
jgi:peptidoglycan/LPS O-acetylase OafA/YrhL